MSHFLIVVLNAIMLSMPNAIKLSVVAPCLIRSLHRDKTIVQMPAKMFPHLNLLCLLFMGSTLGFDTKQRNSFLIKFGGFFLQ